MKKTYIIAIDEAGRGPWAGPIVVGGWMAEFSLSEGLLSSLPGLDDSKQLSHEKRESLFSQIEMMQYRSECQYAFSYRDAHIIDEVGIREANRQCMQDVILSLLQFVDDTDSVQIFIDGCDNYQFSLGDFEYVFAEKKRRKEKGDGEKKEKKEKGFRTVQYIIHGDSLVPAISAASIVAKVVRDRMMCDFHEDFPQYGFDSHKGYGTRKHQESLLNYGITHIHRKSYAPVKRLISPSSSL